MWFIEQAGDRILNRALSLFAPRGARTHTRGRSRIFAWLRAPDTVGHWVREWGNRGDADINLRSETGRESVGRGETQTETG